MSFLSEPLFSIICPTFNAEKYIRRCVKSVLRQEVAEWELIIVDDGSTDGTGRICDDLSREDRRIKTFHKDNAGPYLARLFGLKKAIGKYILFLDSDDLLEDHCLSILKKTIFDFSNPDCLIFKVSEIDFHGNSKKIIKNSSNCGLINNNEEVIEKCFFDEIYWYLYEKCFKRDILVHLNLESNPFCTYKLGEDTLMSYLGLKECRNVYFIDDYLYLYLRTPNSLTSNKNPRVFLECFKIYGFIYDDISKLHNKIFSVNNGWCSYFLNASFAFLESCCLSLNFKDAKSNFNFVRKNKLFIDAISKVRKKGKQLFLMSLIKNRFFLIFYFIIKISKLNKR